MKIEISNSATRFLALSAIALTLSALPSRADWTTVRADGSVVTVQSNPKPNSHTLQVTNGANEYASEGDVGNAPNIAPSNVPNVATYDGPNQARSARVQANRDRNRQRNNRNNPGRIRSVGGLGYGGNLNYGAAPVYPGYVVPGYNYNVPSYPYGVPYGYNGYPGTVVAPGATIVTPPTPYSIPIAPAPYPWVRPPVFTSIPLGGTTIITNRGDGGYQNGYPNGYYPPQVAYPYGYPQSYSYPNGSVTQSYGGISISRGGVSASIGGSTTSTQTQTTWGTGLYR
jgi:hypothetical protein